MHSAYKQFMASALLLTVTLTIESRVNNEAVVWGFYNIPVCPQQPLVIQYESRTPFRKVPVDGMWF